MANLIEQLNGQLGKALDAASAQGHKLRGARRGRSTQAGPVARDSRQAPAADPPRYWLRTGYVAAGKIINLHIPELYSIVRGKVGRTVEFGLSWGITRLRGGFVLATMARDKADLQDTKFAVRAVEDLVTLFGKAPRAYAYDRAGHSAKNVERLGELGVPRCGTGPPGTHTLAGRGQGERPTHQGAGAGRRLDRHYQGGEIRLQSSRGPLGRDDGRLRSARSLGLQPHEAGSRDRRATEIDPGRMSGAPPLGPCRAAAGGSAAGGGTARAPAGAAISTVE